MIKVFLENKDNQEFSLRVEGHSEEGKDPSVCATITMLADQCSIVPKIIGDGCIAKVERDIAYTRVFIHTEKTKYSSYAFLTYWEILQKTLLEIEKKYPDQIKIID